MKRSLNLIANLLNNSNCLPLCNLPRMNCMKTHDEGTTVGMHHNSNTNTIWTEGRPCAYFPSCKLEQVLMILEDTVIRVGGSRNLLGENQKNFQAWGGLRRGSCL